MGQDSKVSWCDHTFNPIWGCTKLPERRECDHCYAEAFARRTGNKCWNGGARRTFGVKHWQEPIIWNSKAFLAGRTDTVFCASMCDVFEDHEAMEAERPRLWDLIRKTTNLRWLLLTKRPLNAPPMLPVDLWLNNPRVLVGATVGTQMAAAYPCAVDFLSCEPLLERIDITRWLQDKRLRTVIVGGESDGPRMGRTCFEDWVRDLAMQVRGAGRHLFVKQLHIGGKLVHDPAAFPEDLRVRELAWRQS